MGLFSFAKNIFGDNESNLDSFQLPEFYSDPTFTETTALLKDTGEGILTGNNIPDLLRPLMESGGPEFQNLINRVTSRVQKSVTESVAAQGRGRGGSMSGRVAGAVADTTSTLGYQDYLRSLAGRGDIFNIGTNLTKSAADLGFSNQGQKNQFNLNVAGLDFKRRQALDEQDIMEGQMFGQGIGDLTGVIGQVLGGENGGFGGGGGGKGSAIGSTAGAVLATVFGLPPQLGAMAGGTLGGFIDKPKGKINEEEFAYDENMFKPLKGSVA